MLTDRRLLFVQDGLTSKTTEDFPMDKVSSVQWSSGMLVGNAEGRPRPFLPGTTYGRVSQPSIRRALAELDAPASLWHDPPRTLLGDGADADGRRLLHSLTAWKLWPPRKAS